MRMSIVALPPQLRKMAPPIKRQLDAIIHSLYEAAGENLLGLYLHGSLAMGCFHPGASDIDLVGITQEPLPANVHRAMLHALLAASGAPAPVEISTVHYAQIVPWRHPTPFDLHYSEMHRTSARQMLADPAALPGEGRVDADLAAHFTVMQRRGLCLWGAPLKSLKIEVPWADYIDSLRRDFVWAQVAGNASLMYAVLNACRILAAVEEQRVLSKAEGAAWALPRIPVSLRAVVKAAAARYAGTERELSETAGALLLGWVRTRVGW
ncbi:MAG: DUF4111 domain-containing protein [Caldilineaceae bacterium]|nr:DUF4111 domain-containing protein [Caldilineaceae bacterium]